MRKAGAVLALMLVSPAQAEISKPAELPPADYAGQQYVDSKGCLFMRAGQPGQEIWLPRVTRAGVPLCGNPPSGRRVPVVEEGAAETAPLVDTAPAGVAEPGPAAEAASPAPEAVQAGYFVAVGSFGQASNIDRAVERVTALNYQVVRGQLQGADGTLVTIFAGPFDSVAKAERAREELRGAGFPDAVLIQ